MSLLKLTAKLMKDAIKMPYFQVKLVKDHFNQLHYKKVY